MNNDQRDVVFISIMVLSPAAMALILAIINTFAA